MLQYLGLTALDIANDRAREARNQAEGWRLLEGSDAHVRETPARPGFGRRAAAGALRRLSTASLSVGEAACEAASRLEQRTA
jgi:hypothetical protein